MEARLTPAGVLPGQVELWQFDPDGRPHGLARRTDPGTSWAAARSVDPSGQWAVILRTLARIGDATSSEIGLACPLTEHQLSRRLSELGRAGRIVWTGATRPGLSGRHQRVWAIAP
jgi:hypothetical protein